MKWGAGPCGTTSAVSLPWNIGRTKARLSVGRLERDHIGDDRLDPSARRASARNRASGTCAGERPATATADRSRPARPRYNRPACTARGPGSRSSRRRDRGGRELGRRRCEAGAHSAIVIGCPEASCCAAAMASHVARLSVPPRCSAITRIHVSHEITNSRNHDQESRE